MVVAEVALGVMFGSGEGGSTCGWNTRASSFCGALERAPVDDSAYLDAFAAPRRRLRVRYRDWRISPRAFLDTITGPGVAIIWSFDGASTRTRRMRQCRG